MINPPQRNMTEANDELETEANALGHGDKAKNLTPTWFPKSLRPLPPEDLADRYRALRAEPYSERSRSHDHADNDSEFRPQRRTPPPRPRQPAQAEEPRTSAMRTSAYLAAGFAAALAGGVVGFAATQYDSLGKTASGMLAMMMPPAAQQAPNTVKTNGLNNQSTVAKKPISTATLNVSDVSGGLNSMIPMMLHAEPAVAGEDLILEISGLPESAYLTAGHKSEGSNWQIGAAEAEGVKLVVPRSAEPKFDVSIAAFEAKTGQLAAPIKEITVAIDGPPVTIAPANAEPDTVTVKPADIIAAKQDQFVAAEVPPEAQSLTAKGDILLKSGDLAMARQFYERAFAKGSIEAAIGAGKTYDPVVYTSLRVQGLKPDPARAMEWYMRASAAGNKDAISAIEALKQAAP